MAIEIKPKSGRVLPVFLLVDTSGSMHGDKISCVNVALREMMEIFSNLDNPRGKININLISFGEKVEVLHSMTPPDKIILTDLKAYGKTPMGAAIEKAVEIIDDPTVKPENSYYSTIVLISDGLPTDCDINFLRNNDFSDWEPMKKLAASKNAQKCQRLSLAIGNDANCAMLKKFIDNPEIPVIKANDVQGIIKFFKWVTMSVSVRSQSSMPNNLTLIPAEDYFGDEELVF